MKDEIKEILDRLKNENNYQVDCNDGSAFKELFANEIYLLLDYITNLQTIEQQYSAILSENAELENKITNLQEELEYQKQAEQEYNEKHTKLMKKYKDYKSRNEKAIESLTKNKFYINLDEVLNILQGEDKDE